MKASRRLACAAIGLTAASACALTRDWSVADRTLDCTASVVFSATNEIFYGLAVDSKWVYVVSFNADFSQTTYSIYRVDKSLVGSAAGTKIYSGSSFVLACEATGSSLGTLCGVGSAVMQVKDDGTLVPADGVNTQLGNGINVIDDMASIDGGVLFALNAYRGADAASGRVAFVSSDLQRIANHPEIKDPSRIVVRGNLAAVGRIATTANGEPLPPVSLYDLGALTSGAAVSPLFDDPIVTGSIADIAMLDDIALYALFDKGGSYALRRVAPDGAAAVPVSPLSFGLASTGSRVFDLVYTDGTENDTGPLSALAEIYDPSDWALLCSVAVPPPIRTPYGRHAVFDATNDVYFVDGQSLYVMHVSPAE